MNTTHLYSVTVSNITPARLDRLLAGMPSKYFDCFVAADKVAICQSAPVPVSNNAGSGEAYFVMDANKANALRKWFKRRFKGRSKFARQIVPTQFCACVNESEVTA